MPASNKKQYVFPGFIRIVEHTQKIVQEGRNEQRVEGLVVEMVTGWCSSGITTSRFIASSGLVMTVYF